MVCLLSFNLDKSIERTSYPFSYLLAKRNQELSHFPTFKKHFLLPTPSNIPLYCSFTYCKEIFPSSNYYKSCFHYSCYCLLNIKTINFRLCTNFTHYLLKDAIFCTLSNFFTCLEDYWTHFWNISALDFWKSTLLKDRN